MFVQELWVNTDSYLLSEADSQFPDIHKQTGEL